MYICGIKLHNVNHHNISPLSAEQYAHFEALLNSLDPTQMSWIAGFFAARVGSVSNTPLVPLNANKVDEFTILYASLTGKSEALAFQAFAMAKQKGKAVRCIDLNEFKAEEIASLNHVLLLVSTHGNGAPAFPAKKLLAYLKNKSTQRLPNLHFAVLALGDSSYDHFCKAGIDFDLQLEKLGAKRIAPIHLGDVDVEKTAANWIEQVLSTLKGVEEKSASSNFTFLKNAVKKQSAFVSNPAAKVKSKALVVPTAFASKPAAHALKPSLQHPFLAKVLSKKYLNTAWADRQTLHLELDIHKSGLSFQPGDSVGILPSNHPDLIRAFLDATGWNANESISYNGTKQALSVLLKDGVELSKITPDVVKKYLSVANNEGLKKLALQPETLANYLTDRDIIDLITDFKPENASPEQVLSALRALQPRYYSIASSPLKKKDSLDLCIGVVDFEKGGRNRRGTCSTYLSDTVVENEHVALFVEPNPEFRLPENPATPIVMLSAGTGVAPFRAFLQHRSLTPDAGKSWLFFGNRHRKTEFLYETDWLTELEKGNLTQLDTAFSRDEKEPYYLQQLVRQRGSELYDWINEGAYIYLCGSKNGFSRDVQQALTDIVAKHAGLSPEMAEAYLQDMRETGRFQLDVY